MSVSYRYRPSCYQLQRNNRLFFRISIKGIKTDKIAIRNYLITSCYFRPIYKSIKHIHAVGPAFIHFASAIVRKMVPSTLTCICYNTHHITIFPFQLGIIFKMWHNQWSKNTIASGRNTDILQCLFITFSSIASAHKSISPTGFHATVKSIFIPTEKIHTNIFYS